MTAPVCPCDGAAIAPPVNLPQLPQIAYRVGDYAAFRRAVLMPLDGETALSIGGVPVWRTDGAGDLAVMIAEWFAYVADILTFYNERIANQDYLRTADLPESVTRLIALLGYRPRPAIGATGTLAALVTAGQNVVLPRGLQFQSKPTPGLPPQTFELAAATAIGAPDQIAAAPASHLLATPESEPWVFTAQRARFGTAPLFGWIARTPKPLQNDTYGVLLQGQIDSVDPGALLMLRPRDPARGGPLLATVAAASVADASGGGKQTTLHFTLSGDPPDGLTAAQARLETAVQSATVWALFSGAISGATVHMASLTRQIAPGDWLLFAGHGVSPALAQVRSTSETIWDATGSAQKPREPADTNHPVPVPHTVLTLRAALPGAWQEASGVSVRFDWRSVGTLLDQPFLPWTGAPNELTASGTGTFPSMSDLPLIVQDSAGAGLIAAGSSPGGPTVTLGDLPDPAGPLLPPFQILPNLLPVTRGRTVANEVLGSGDPTNPGQDFALSQSPVTYLQNGAGYASTIALTVGGAPWTEVVTFYGQPADAEVFVTREDEAGRTHVMFGDGVNGARLPAGRNNVVAAYRVGAGADSPPAGKLTVIAQSFPGLRSVLNPVAVGGGADPDPPDQIRRYAPRSVLTFGRAVSVFDYEAIAAQAPGVARACAVWAWSDVRQRTLVTVFVGDDDAAATSARAALAGAGDPNRPVAVVRATPHAVRLDLTVAVAAGRDTGAIGDAIVAALTGPDTGLFAAATLGIGVPLFDSRIEAAVLAVDGTVAITAARFRVGNTVSVGPLHAPGEGAFFTLDPADIALTTEAAA